MGRISVPYMDGRTRLESLDSLVRETYFEGRPN